MNIMAQINLREPSFIHKYREQKTTVGSGNFENDRLDANAITKW
jgi:hypothetical protein